MVAAVLYGSVARGDHQSTSDVDVLVVGESIDVDVWTPVVIEVEQRLSRYIGREIHVIATDWPTKSELKRPFWNEVVRDGRPLGGARVTELVSG